MDRGFVSCRLLIPCRGRIGNGYCYAYDQFKIGCDHDQFRIGYGFDRFIIGYGDDQFIIGCAYDQFKIGCTYDQLIIGCAYDQFKIGCACDQFIIGQIDHFKVVLYPKFDEMCGFRKITKRGLLNVLKRIHVTFSIAIHSKSRYSANSASG